MSPPAVSPVQGSKFKVQGSRFALPPSLPFPVQGSKFKVQGSRFAFPRCLSLAFLTLLLSAVCALASGTELSAGEFDSANRLYGQGKFTEAAAGYEKLLLSGQTSAALYFNLGNAWFKAGQIGRALAAYRNAEALAPRDPDIRANLQFARNQIQGPTLTPERWQTWLSRLTLNEWTLLAAGSLWLWLLLLSALQLRPAWKPALRGYVLPLGIVAAVLCLSLAAAFYQARSARLAIMVAHDAVVHASPLEESQPAFTAHDGAEMRVLDQKDEWLQVTIDPRRLGWVHKDQVLVLPQPSPEPRLAASSSSPASHP
jgi:hypothetical protein